MHSLTLAVFVLVGQAFLPQTAATFFLPLLKKRCVNGRTFVKGGGKRGSCECPDGFTGKRCQIKPGLCPEDPIKPCSALKRCKNDSHCPGKAKCCRIKKCGKRCLNPEKNIGPVLGIELSIVEMTPVNTELVKVQGSEEDGAIPQFTLTQNDPEEPEYFQIDANTGLITVKEIFGFDDVESISLTAACIDSGKPQLTSSIPITVQVNELFTNFVLLSEPSCVDVQEIGDQTAAESAPVGTPVVDVQVTLADVDPYNFRLEPEEGTPDNLLTLDAFTGQITVASSLEGRAGVYMYRVTASNFAGCEDSERFTFTVRS